MARRRRRNYGWAQAGNFLEQALRERLGESAPIEIGWINYRGKGLCRRSFIADAEVSGNPEWSRTMSSCDLTHSPIPSVTSELGERETAHCGLDDCRSADKDPWSLGKS